METTPVLAAPQCCCITRRALGDSLVAGRPGRPLGLSYNSKLRIQDDLLVPTLRAMQDPQVLRTTSSCRAGQPNLRGATFWDLVGCAEFVG